MPELAIAGDISIDLATKDDVLSLHRGLAEQLKPPAGAYYRIYATGQTATGFSGSGPIAICFTPFSPPAGRIWAVQWVALWVGTSPANPATANLNAALMIGRSPVGPGGPPGASFTPSNSDVVVPGQTVPASITVPDKTIVYHADQLYAILAGSGLAASTVYNASAGVLDLPDKAEALLW